MVIVALGAGASAVGQVLLDHQRGLNQIAGVVVIFMGLAMAGLVTPQLLTVLATTAALVGIWVGLDQGCSQPVCCRG